SIEVVALNGGDNVSSVNVSAANGAALPVVVLQYRKGESGLITGRHRVAVLAFHDIPSEVGFLTHSVSCRRDVDFFPITLSDVGDVEVAGRTVKTETPGIAKSVTPDLLAHIGSAGKGIVSGNDIGRSRPDVESQNGTEQVRQVLAATQRISARASITKSEIEVAIGSEEYLPAVVIRKRLLSGEHELLGGRIRQVRIAG